MNGSDHHPGANFVECTIKPGVKTKKFLKYGNRK